MTNLAGQPGGALKIRFFLPSPQLAPYVTTYYLTETEGLGEGTIEDYLHPEWGNVRLAVEGRIAASIGSGPIAEVPRFVATGPTSLSTRFRLSSGRYWGIGLLPAGWARFVDAPARSHADRYAEIAADPAFARLRPLAEAVAGCAGIAEEHAVIDSHMLGLLDRPGKDEERTLAAHRALLDTEVESVAALAAAVGISPRSLERLASQVFGFPPKLLLRRQRFLRCLAQFMLDPSLKWLRTMDWHYHDQAHFTRDFRRFMGMSPREYARLDHPVLRAAAIARLQAAGEAVQGLHSPDGIAAHA